MTISRSQLLEGRHLTAERRRALETIAAAGLNGCTIAALFARGFTIDMLANLALDGLAILRRQTLKIDGRKVMTARVWIAEAGEQVLKGARAVEAEPPLRAS